MTLDRWESPITDRVRLRDVTEGDLPTLFLHQLDPEATAMAAFTSRDREAFDAHWRRILADPTATKKTILVGEVVAGNIGAFTRAGDRLVGYWLGREHWGQGLATRALQMFLDQEPARPLRAYVAKHNVGSIRVLEKAGFVVVGEEDGSAQGDGVEELVFELGERSA
jgi:RimJ/RimL family protein N-acetyltransferase